MGWVTVCSSHSRRAPGAAGLPVSAPRAPLSPTTSPLFMETPSSLRPSQKNPELCGRDSVSFVDFRIFRVWDRAWHRGDRMPQWGRAERTHRL